MHLMESFLDKDSIAFELIKYVVSDIESNESKELSFDTLKFTSKTLKYVFGDMLKEETFKSYAIDSIKKMIADNWIEPKSKSMYITETMLTNFYNVN